MAQRDAPLVSVVTPVLNGARFLPAHLESIRGQQHPRLEHLVVDGGSSDGTLELLRGAPGVRLISEPDGGIYDAINKGLRLAGGELVGFLNADDRYVVPDAVTSIVAAFAANPGADVIYGRFRYIDELGRPSRKRAPRGLPFRRERLERYNCVPPHATFVRRASVVDAGLWLDGRLQFAGDWEWALRLARAGKSFVFLDRVLSEFRLHPGSKTRLLGFRAKLAEWSAICRSNRISLGRLLWYESVWVPLCRRLGRAA